MVDLSLEPISEETTYGHPSGHAFAGYCIYTWILEN